MGKRKTLKLGENISPEDLEKAIEDAFDEGVGDVTSISEDKNTKNGGKP